MTIPRDSPTPKLLTRGGSLAELAAAGNYLSGRIANWLGVDKIPFGEIAYSWAAGAGGNEGVRLSNWAGLRTTTQSPLDYLLHRAAGSTVQVRRDAGGWPEVEGVLAHEVAHAYMLRYHGTDKDDWVQESFADYIALQLGYTQVLDVGQPETTAVGVGKGYASGARFMLWLDAIKPGATKEWAQRIFTGIYDDAGSLEDVMDAPLPLLIAAYEDDPYPDNPTGPLSRYLKQRSGWEGVGRQVYDRFMARTQTILRKANRITEINDRLKGSGWEAYWGDAAVIYREKVPYQPGGIAAPSPEPKPQKKPPTPSVTQKKPL